jgi:hypothetical protein
LLVRSHAVDEGTDAYLVKALPLGGIEHGGGAGEQSFHGDRVAPCVVMSDAVIDTSSTRTSRNAAQIRSATVTASSAPTPASTVAAYTAAEAGPELVRSKTRTVSATRASWSPSSD